MQNIKTLFKPLIIGVLTLFIVNSCSNDTKYVKPFDDINILLNDVEETYLYNETLLLDPIVTYGENNVDDSTFSYKWNLVKEEGVELISEEKNLEYVLNNIGTLSIQLLVENNDTHVIQSHAVTINVESVTNKGWYVLKETTEGNTELDGFYIESDHPDYNIIAQKTGAALSGTPKVLASLGRYNENYETITTLQVFSERDGVELNLKEATLSSKLTDMFLLVDNKTEPNIQSGIVNSEVVYLSMGEYGTSYMQNTAPAFFPAIDDDYRIDGQMTMGSYGNALAYDNKNKRYIFFDSSSYDSFYKLGVFADAYSSYNEGFEVSVNNMNGESIFLENTQKGSGWEATYYAYSLFKKDGINDALTLYGLDYDKFVGNYYYAPDFSVIEPGQYSPINFAKNLTSTDYEMLVSSDVYTMNKQVDILYFAKNNVIGSYNINDESYNPSFVNDIPANETITFIKYINTTYTNYIDWAPFPADLEFNGLVVATYNQASNTYKIYRYQLDGLNTISLQDDVKTGTGKVSKVMYVSTSSDWSSDLHLYN